MQKAPRLCRHGRKVTAHQPCEHCQAAARAARARQTAKRPSTSARGYGADWKALRAKHLRSHPFCVECGVVADTVDHIIAHRGDDRLRLDPSNLRSFCRTHHSRKTVRQDGGFGRQPGGIAKQSQLFSDHRGLHDAQNSVISLFDKPDDWSDL